jgi:hypothetical protein
MWNIHVRKVRVYEVYAHEVQAQEVHAYDVYAREVQAYEMHAREMHTSKILRKKKGVGRRETTKCGVKHQAHSLSQHI